MTASAISFICGRKNRYCSQKAKRPAVPAIFASSRVNVGGKQGLKFSLFMPFTSDYRSFNRSPRSRSSLLLRCYTISPCYSTSRYLTNRAFLSDPDPHSHVFFTLLFPCALTTEIRNQAMLIKGGSKDIRREENEEQFEASAHNLVIRGAVTSDTIYD